MKRCFSLLIALVLLVALFPASSAMAECSHSQTTHMCDFYILNKGNSQYHYYVEDSFNKCNTCGAELWPYYNEEAVPHDFVGNKCSECGYTKTCNHSNTKQVLKASGCQYATVTYHEYLYSYQYVCTSCSVVVRDNVMDYEWEEHSFKSNGKCTKCGYQKSSSSSACYHTRTKEVVTDKKYEIIEGNDRQHSVVTHYNKVCTQCNKTISDDKNTQVAAHTFSGNTCTVCGYSKAGTATRRPTATATPRPGNTNNGSGFYVKDKVTVSRGSTTFSWVDSENNGPYEIIFRQYGTEAPWWYRDVCSKQLTVDFVVPGNTYNIYVKNANGKTTKIIDVYVPDASTFVDGKLKASSINVDIEYRTRKSGEEDDMAQKVTTLYAADIEAGLDGNTYYGLRYTINLPQLVKDRTYHTMVVLRDPDGISKAEIHDEYLYSRYANSTGRRYWYCIGESFFSSIEYEHGYIPTGTYYVDLYWDGMWVNTTPFYVY